MMPFHTEPSRPEARNATLLPMRVVVNSSGNTCRIVPPLEAIRPNPYRARWSRYRPAQHVSELANAPSGWPAWEAGRPHPGASERSWLETGRLGLRQRLELLAPILLLLTVIHLLAPSLSPAARSPEARSRMAESPETGSEAFHWYEPASPWMGSELAGSQRAGSVTAGLEAPGDWFGPEAVLLPADRARASSAMDSHSRLTASLSPDTDRAVPRNARLDAHLAASDILWLARGIFSESKRRQEQELVAWVIRNRVETGYQGRSTYRDVVLAPYQFSAFNPGNPKRAWLTALNADSDEPGWPQALEIARRVYHAPASARPFPVSTRHFYSEQSLLEDPPPSWAAAQKLASLTSWKIDAARFQFYDGVL